MVGGGNGMLFAFVSDSGAVNWTTIIVASIVGLPATIGSIAAFIQSYRNGSKADSLAKVVNGMTESRVRAEVESAYAKGKIDGVVENGLRLAAAEAVREAAAKLAMAVKP